MSEQQKRNSLSFSFPHLGGSQAADIANSLGNLSANKRTSGMVMAALRALNALGLTRFPKSFTSRMPFMSAARNTNSPRPGSSNGF